MDPRRAVFEWASLIKEQVDLAFSDGIYDFQTSV